MRDRQEPAKARSRPGRDRFLVPVHNHEREARPRMAVPRRWRGIGLLKNSLDGLHGSDGVKFVPTMVGVVDVGTPDEIALANHGLKIGTVVLAAGFRCVWLPHFALTDRFEDQIALLH